MKRLLLCLTGLLCALCVSVSAQTLEASYISVSNNVGAYSVIEVNGVEPGATVEVYNTSGMLLAKKRASNSSSSVTLKTKLLEPLGGSLTIKVTPKEGEVASIIVAYDPQPVSASADNFEIDIVNNADKKSTITVSGLEPKDIVTVYSEESSTKKLLGGKVRANKDEAVISVPLKRMVPDGGYFWISITEQGKLESEKVRVTYGKQPQSDPPEEADIEIINNVSKKDSITISELDPKDVITIYKDESGKKISSKKVGSNKDEVTFSFSQLSKYGGYIYITLKKPDERESVVAKIYYDPKETTPTATWEGTVALTNTPAGSKDTLYISNLEPKDVIKLYKTEAGSTVYAKGTVKANASDITINTTFSEEGGDYWVTCTRSNMQESARIYAYCSPVVISDKIISGDVLITNYTGKPSEIYVQNLLEKTTIKVWKAASGTALLASGAVAEGETTLTISTTLPSTGSGSVWLSRIEPDSNESERLQYTYDAVQDSYFNKTDSSFNVQITNNVGIADTIIVHGLNPNDVVKAYNKTSGGTLLTSGTVGDLATSITLTVNQLSSVAGQVYLTRTEPGLFESARIAFDYDDEGASEQLDSPDDGPFCTNNNNIKINNNSGIASTLTASNLYGEDIITVYDAATKGTVIGKANVAAYGNNISVELKSLKASGGEIWVTRTSSGLNESPRTMVSYGGLLTSTAPEVGNIKVENNSGIASTVTVECLDNGDEVIVYKEATGSTTLGKATASSIGGSVTISIGQLSSGGGSVYVSVTSTGKAESERTVKTYDPHEQSSMPTNITVTNNSDTSDEIKVGSLLSGDEVKIYRTNSASDTTVLAKATVPSGQNTVTIYASILHANGGSIYVSAKSTGKTESERAEVKYEPESVKPEVNDVSVTNNVDIDSVVVVKSVSAGDVVKIYDSATATQPIASGTASDSEVTIYIKYLSSSAGNIYISVTSYGRTESSRTKVSYEAQRTSSKVGAGQISFAYEADTVTVTVSGLKAYDYIRVYESDSSSASILGSATESSGTVAIPISRSKLNSSGGSVYVTVTGRGENESGRTKSDYTS